MKLTRSKLLAFLVVLACTGVVGCSSPALTGRKSANGTQVAARGAQREQGRSFGLYLVLADSTNSNSAKGWLPEWPDVSNLTLADSPLVSEAEIITYDWSDHSMTVRSSALRRLPEPSLSGNPFVVVADGQRIYKGFLTNPYSSFSLMGEPTIMVYHMLTDYSLDIEYTPVIAGSDPRADPRIREALAALQKLK